MLNFLFSFVTSFIIAFSAIPSIIRIANRHSLFDEPNERKTHRKNIPLLGGIAIFAATIFSFTIWSAQYFESQHLFIFAALIIIFFFGLRDDIAPLAPLKKLSGQIIASLIVIAFCDIRLQGMHGLFGIHSLSVPLSILFTLVAMLFIINAFNLIDGIDGLSSGLGMVASFAFGIMFFAYDDFLMAVLSLALCGALAGFLPYNFYKAKIFMGDTGTMTTGFILSIFSIHFLEITRITQNIFTYFYAPVVVLAVLIVPVTDMMRVFVIRISKFRSPFSPDRNHIHHRLLSFGFTDAQAALVLYCVTIIFISAAWLLRNQNPLLVFYGLLASAIVLSQVPFLISSVKSSRTATQK